MGRNPVVGRQGPEYHAAVAPSEQESATIAVKQIRSAIGHPENLRRILRALGLRHHQQTVTLKNTASARGMIYKVRHLVEVGPAVSGKR
jgi:large subunit ribosomal protein L30